jgi:transposase-like protein
MSKLAQVGEYCPNKDCADYGKRQSDQQQNITKYGKNRAGRQRYYCQTCQKVFAETKGTLFYKRRTSDEEIIEVLALLAEGTRISSIARVKGHKEDTILAWLREAAKHVEAIEEVLLAKYKLKRGQLDGLWAYVGNKGEKRITQKATTAANSGGQR